MPMSKCRVCGHEFFKEPLLRYENMPKAAQFLPDAESLKSDKGIDLKVCQCSGCGLVQLNNKPVSYYKEVIRASAFSSEMREFRLKQFKGFVKKYSLKNKKIIEVGCGRGEYLSMMQQAGVKAYGLEQSKESVRQCVKNGLKVFQGFVESSNYKIEESPYDAFFILNFLEHLPDPNSVLSGIYNNLSDGAVGIVEVPNFDMILRKKLFSEFISDHLFYFTKDTLETTLKLSGFEVIDCDEVWHDYIISAVVNPVRNYKIEAQKSKNLSSKRYSAKISNGVKKREKLDLSHFYKYQEKLKAQVKKYIDRFGNKKVAIWGAGHQALAAISMMELVDKIKYVVDSAPFKQGRYTPATHLPIVSPDILMSDPVDAVIVMTASYSDEVARILLHNYDSKINIGILRNYGLEVLSDEKSE